ncbi:MAG TPA: hypothetical protein DIC18_03030 [Clostridiales bacterium]|nr:hypothetical protein [Clostridiales bacterium]
MIATILVLTAIYTFYMGYTDGSNAVATCITTKAMDARVAIYLSAAIQFLTVVAMYFLVKDMSVAATIGKGMIDNAAFDDLSTKAAFIFILSALLSSILWSVITFFLKQPNSTSHTLLGGIIGAGIGAFGFSSILWSNVFLRIILMIFLAPIVSVVIGFFINRILRRIALRATAGAGKVVKVLQWGNVILLSSAISVNDAQKSFGIYLLLVTIGLSEIAEPPAYLAFVFGLALALGMIFGGYRIIITIGNKLFKIRPLMSLSSQIATNLVIFSSSALGIPISTGQVISSTIVGIGISERARGVRWLTVKRIVLGWVITMPATITFGALFYLLTNLILGGIL